MPPTPWPLPFIIFSRLMKPLKKFAFFKLTRRRRLVVAALFLCLGLLATMLIGGLRVNFPALAALVVLAYPIIYWALQEEIVGFKKISLFVLPLMLTLAVGLFYFLTPVRWLTRLTTVGFYALAIYAAILTVNIYNVASLRSIGLFRVGRTIGFLLTIITALLLTHILFSFHPHFWLIGLGVFAIVFPLSLAELWAVKLAQTPAKQLLVYSLLVSFLASQFGVVISFWPTQASVSSIFVTAVFYQLLGLSSHFLGKSLYKKTLREFIVIAFLVLLIILGTTSWRG